MKNNRIIPLTVILFFTIHTISCGNSTDISPPQTAAQKGTTPPTEAPKLPQPVADCSLESYQKAPVAGRFWQDQKQVGLTDVAQGVLDPDSDSLKGIAGAPVSLILPGNRRLDTVTCSDGRYHFDSKALNGAITGIIDFHNTKCTTANCPTKLAELAGKRPIKIVTFGDSIPSYPRRAAWFPEYLVGVASSVAEIDNVNVAIPGTRTGDWLPSSKNFMERIQPNADADIFIFSIGGNNILLDGYPQLLLSILPTTLHKRLKVAEAKIEEAVAQSKQIIDGIRAIAPNADILWVSYQDYSRSFKTLLNLRMQWKRDKIAEFIRQSLELQRTSLSGYKGTMTLDMYGLSQKTHPNGRPYKNEDYLIADGIHLNQRGHYFYAAQIFRALGGFFIGEKLIGPIDQINEFHDLGTKRFIGYP